MYNLKWRTQNILARSKPLGWSNQLYLTQLPFHITQHALFEVFIWSICMQLDVIGIDEAQFFGDLYDFCRNAADHDGKTVVVAGLDGDYLR